MKKIINITFGIYVILFLLIALLRLIFNTRIFIYSESFFNIRPFYLISVIIVLMILRCVVASNKDTLSKIKYLVANILIILIISFSVFYSIAVFFSNDNSYKKYIYIKNNNTGEEYFVNQSAVVRSGYISIGKPYYNCLLHEKQRIYLGNESSAQINEIRWKDSTTMLFDCVIETEYTGNIKNKTFTVYLDN